jgi:hypothetical protein
MQQAVWYVPRGLANLLKTQGKVDVNPVDVNPVGKMHAHLRKEVVRTIQATKWYMPNRWREGTYQTGGQMVRNKQAARWCVPNRRPDGTYQTGSQRVRTKQAARWYVPNRQPDGKYQTGGQMVRSKQAARWYVPPGLRTKPLSGMSQNAVDPFVRRRGHSFKPRDQLERKEPQRDQKEPNGKYK